MDELDMADLYVELLESPPTDEAQKLARKDAFIKLALQHLKDDIDNAKGRWNAWDIGKAMVDIYQALNTVEAVLEELKKAAYPNYQPLPPPTLPPRPKSEHPKPEPPRLEPKTLPPDIAPVDPRSR
jgi:hypothetical protein